MNPVDIHRAAVFEANSRTREAFGDKGGVGSEAHTFWLAVYDEVLARHYGPLVVPTPTQPGGAT